MTAVPTNPIGQFTPQAYPFITPETRELLAQEKVRLMRDESARVPAADLHRSEKFIFRSLPGTMRMIYHDIDIPPQKGTKHYEHYRYQWERRQIEAAGLGPDSTEKEREAAVKAAEKRVADLEWRNGGTKIIFHRVRRHNECYFPTNDEVLAAYVRELMVAKRGAFADVYEVSGNARLVVGEMAFPDTEMGMRAAKAYARDNDIYEIKLVKE